MKELLYIDLFCGAGGTSTGVERARLFGRKCGRVIACVNHDPNAIASHAANHPGTLHFTEDIRTLDLTALKEYTDIARRQSPKSPLVLWASLECTNFSKAKGGKPRDADSRTLAEQKKFIGNAVEVNTSKALCEALAERLWEIAQGRQTFQTSEERTPCTAN